MSRGYESRWTLRSSSLIVDDFWLQFLNLQRQLITVFDSLSPEERIPNLWYSYAILTCTEMEITQNQLHVQGFKRLDLSSLRDSSVAGINEAYDSSIHPLEKVFSPLFDFEPELQDILKKIPEMTRSTHPKKIIHTVDVTIFPQYVLD